MAVMLPAYFGFGYWRLGLAATARRNNPYCEWIGADIRSDGWAYAAPGWPELAAEFANRDARLSHRWNGIYGEMFFSAAISAAFATSDVSCCLCVLVIPPVLTTTATVRSSSAAASCCT